MRPMRAMRAILGMLGLLLLTVRASDPAGAASRPPNILLLVADDLGYGELGIQGNPEIPTPNVDALARSGVRFTDGYVSAPVCSPSRAGLFTGRYQERFGHEFNPSSKDPDEPGLGLALSETTVAQRLREAGYRTGLIGKWHLGGDPVHHPVARGFDEFFGFTAGGRTYYPTPSNDPGRAILQGRRVVEEREYLTDAFTREATAFIRRNADRPFFLAVTYNAVHAPLQAPPALASRFTAIRDPQRRTFAAMLSSLDTSVGNLMATLRSLGLEDRTLVTFLSDNGGPAPTTSSNLPLRGHKGEVWEGGIRIPFMATWKGVIPAGQVLGTPVMSLDLTPTFLAAAGVASRPEWGLDGVNILPWVTGRATGPVHERLYWRFGSQGAIRGRDWKLRLDDGKARELFDLSQDPGERRNLAAREAPRVAELRAAWQAWNASLPPVPRR